MSKKTVKYCRKTDRNIVYPATDHLLRKCGLVPCDKDGKFITGLDEIPAAPGVQIVADTGSEDVGLLPQLIERATELGIKRASRMKEETLVTRIAEAEDALAASEEAFNAKPEADDETGPGSEED